MKPVVLSRARGTNGGLGAHLDAAGIPWLEWPALLLEPREPEGGFAPGEVIAYRCEDCLDRWDIQFDPDGVQ